MTSVKLRNMGTTGTYAPIGKRMTARLSTGQSVVIVPDTNRSTANGDDVTGTAKIFVYLSTDAARTAYTLVRTHTTGTAFASSTKAAVISCTVRENNNLYVVYQGTDNSLRLITFAFSAGTYGTAGTEQTIAAATAVTSRYRAVDIDASPTNSAIAVAVYEAAASTGQGAYARVHVRRTDDTTWVQAYSEQFFTTQFIRSGSEDVSIAWNKAGPSSNVNQFALYFTKVSTAGDDGDSVREISVNVVSATGGSATVVGSWYTSLYKNIASSARRGFLFSEANNQWVLGLAVGASVPFFVGARLQHNVFTGVVLNQTSVAILGQRDRFMSIYADNNTRIAVTAEYSDYALVFAFSGYGILSSYIARSAVIRFSSTTTNHSALTVDLNARVLDNGYSIHSGVIGIFGGGNKNLTSGLTAFNFATMYGAAGDSVSATVGVLSREMWAVHEDTLTAPTVLSPKDTVVTKDRPTVRISGQNANVYTNVSGKLQIQMATDTTFVSNLLDYTQPDSEFQSYSATSGTTPPIRTITYDLTQAQARFSGTWYIRVRMVDDLGGTSAWSSTETFTISHPPVAQTLSPVNGSSMLYGTGSIQFSWNFSDTEPLDSQSAYRLVITRTDTGATVSDSGKIVSSLKTISVAISSALKDIPLQWTVSLWDSDDAQGAFSTPVVFTLVDPPVGAITTPTPGGTPINPNGTFEVNAANWTAAGGVFARITTQFHSGVASGQLTPDGVTVTPNVSSDFFSVTAGHAYRFSVWVRTPTTWAQQINASIAWYTAGSVLISSTDNTIPSLTGATWTQIQNQSVTPPPTATQAKIFVDIGGTPAAANVLQIDDVEFGRPAVTSAFPSVSWNFSVGGVRTQRAFRVQVWDLLEDPDVEIGDSGWVFSSATTYTFDTQLLEQFGSYRIDLQVQDTVGLTDSDSVVFTTDWVEPVGTTPTLTADEFKVTVTWDDTNIDGDWVGWRLYRRYMKPAIVELDTEDTAVNWELLFETSELLTDYTYYDYTVPLNREVDYTVVQVVDRFGSILESNITGFESITTEGDRYYFVPEVPIGSIASFEAAFVTGDSFVREVEQASLHVIGRGRQMQIGDDLGYNGTLTVRLRNPDSARADREFFEYLASDDAGNVYIRSPFGDVLYVAFGNISTQRIAGVGNSDMVDLTVPYFEVYKEAPIVRAGS